MDGLTRYGGPPLEYSLFSLGSPGTSYTSTTSARTRDDSLEQRVRSISEVDDIPGLIALLQQILVLDPLQRPDVSGLLDHPWFVDSSSPAIQSNPATPLGSASE